jgi:hypothetical protein
MIKIIFLARKPLYYFSPLNTFMGKEKDPDPDPNPRFVLVKNGSGCGSGRPKNIRIVP